MRINVTSVLVLDDQHKALEFYTDVLGFVKKTDVPLGEHRWLTVVSPGIRRDRVGVEPDGQVPARKTFKHGVVDYVFTRSSPSVM